MLSWLRTSLSARAGFAVTLIATLALCSAVSAVLIASISQGDAAAINTAGSLRMATYRMVWELDESTMPVDVTALADDMRQRLTSEALVSRLDTLGNKGIQDAYQAVTEQWQGNLLPALQQRNKDAFRDQVASFTAHLEHFIELLQRQAETRQAWQQGIQGAALLLTIIILFVGMYELHNGVLQPLRALVSTTERFRAGNLDARVAHQSEDELGVVAERFNAMAEDIEQSHQLLEQRVAEKTHNLARSNAALELLLSSSRKMASSLANIGQLEELIDSFQKHLPGLILTLCLRGDDHEAQKPIALYGNAQRKICSISECSDCELYTDRSGKVVSITSQGKPLGEIRAIYGNGQKPSDTEQELLQALADYIGATLSLENQRERSKHLLLMDERTTIARELHDSLAQELSYMKFQVSRLQTLIQRGEQNDQILKVSHDLREGLNSAYRHLRELLTTFRLQVRDGGLAKALDDTVREFADKGDLEVSMDCETLAFPLSSNEQINVLQIVREALSNCVHHAQASHARIDLRQDAGYVEVSIQDDGIGMGKDFDTRQHHGLSIMQERARSLDGSLMIDSSVKKGARILLRFPPEFLEYSETRA